MTTETILTSQQVANIWPKSVEEISLSKFNDVLKFARDIEKDVLQSEQVQAWKRDAERYRWLRQEHIEDVAIARGLDAMDYGSSAVVSTYSEELVGEELDEVIDAAIRSSRHEWRD